MTNKLIVLGGKNDGTFWISYHDFLRRFCCVDVCKAHTEEGWTGVSHECYTRGDKKEGTKPGSHFDPIYLRNSVSTGERSEGSDKSLSNGTYRCDGMYGTDTDIENETCGRVNKCDVRNLDNDNSFNENNRNNSDSGNISNDDNRKRNYSNINTISNNNMSSINNMDVNDINGNNNNNNNNTKTNNNNKNKNNNNNNNDNNNNNNNNNTNTNNNKNKNNEKNNYTINDYNHTIKDSTIPSPKSQNTPYCISADSHFTLTVLDRTWLYVTIIQKSKRGKSKSVTDRTYWYSSLSVIIFEIIGIVPESVKEENRTNSDRNIDKETEVYDMTNSHNGENKKWVKCGENNRGGKDNVKYGKRLGNVVAYSFAGAVRDSPPMELQLPPGVCVCV